MKYTPGVCNIDSYGQRKRGLIGGGAFLVALVLIWWLDGLLEMLAFFPLWIGFLGLWQAKYSFCVANASKSVYEVKGKLIPVNKKYLSQDKKQALKIHVLSLFSAVIVIFLIQILK